jgi:hypothetical protein
MPMMLRMYQANTHICRSDFKIVEALFACTAYMLQVPLIPVYALVLGAWTPVQGFAVGFARVAYSVIFYSNAHSQAGCGWLLNTLGITGLAPAVRQLGADIDERWQDGEKRVTRVYERLLTAQERLLHCFSGFSPHRSPRASMRSSRSRPSVARRCGSDPLSCRRRWRRLSARSSACRSRSRHELTSPTWRA